MESIDELCIHLGEFEKEKEKKQEGLYRPIDNYYHAGCDKCTGYNKACMWYINKEMKV